MWLVWSSDRIEKQLGADAPIGVTGHVVIPRALLLTGQSQVVRLLRAIRYGMYFSILSAFHIGWRDLNVGTWISRMQPNEYTMRATGLVRVASGIQSLISVYLAALWVLTYFGRPFE